MHSSFCLPPHTPPPTSPSRWKNSSPTKANCGWKQASATPTAKAGKPSPPIPSIFKPAQTATSPFPPPCSRNSDIIVGTAGLRYGITRKTEIYGNASYLWRSDRSFNGEARSSTAQNLSDITLGISHTFKQDGKNPALAGFAETSVYEKAGGKASAAKSWLIGASTYKAIDPVVLSLTTAYRRNGSRKLDAGRYKAGDYFMLSPSVSFAANDRISFTGGVQWIARQADRLDGKKLSSSNTATYANLGVGYGISRETSISANARFNVSGRSSTTLRLGMQHTF